MWENLSVTDTAASIADLMVVALRCGALSFSASSDSALLEAQRQLALARRQLDVASAAIAAEIAHRSRRELGYDGLAQRMGARSPQALVQVTTGASAAEARRLVSVGTAVSAPPSWLAPLTAALSDGRLTLEAFDLIRTALGIPDDSVSVDALASAARTLADLAPTLTLERLTSRARELRDELDVAGVELRESQRRERRYFRLHQQHDGMTRVTGLLDPESAAVLVGALDAATSPRRGGPRFVDAADSAWAKRVLDDSRTTEQLSLDALVELVDVAVRARGVAVPGTRRSDVRVLVTQADLDRREGVGFIEGQVASVSVATVEKHACDGGLVPILFADDGRTLNLGRSQRLHSGRQRIAIASRDGGCRFPQCERPPGWCEVHHITPFGEGGATDVADGVLLCRHHHMLVHNNRWRISRTGAAYKLIPPASIDPRQVPIPLESKSAAVRRLLATG